jgi:O-antigen/teichoic acid export membrane protein
MSTKKVLFKNVLSSSWGKASTMLFRIVQIPIALYFLGVDEYGRWLILSSLPTWLSLANFGFGSVAANDISMAVAGNDWERARNVFSTSLALTIIIFITGTFLSVVTAPFLPWEGFLNVDHARHAELAHAAIWLAVTIFASFFSETLGARFRSSRSTHVMTLISSFRPWMDLVAMSVAMSLTKRLDILAFALATSTFVFLGVVQFLSLKYQPDLKFTTSDVRPADFRRLFRKGVSFQAFPLGNALLFQGNLLIIQSFLGPAAVVTFATARTLIRSVNQFMELVNQAIWPELSHLLGLKDYARAARLHRLATGASIVGALLCVAALFIFGQKIYTVWTGHALQLSQNLLLLFLLPIPFTTIWFTSSVVHAASNQHEGLAVRYMIATILAVGACAALTHFYGLEGAALSTLMADIVLIPYVLRRSLALTNDTWRGYLFGIVKELGSIKEFLVTRRASKAATR